MRVQVLYKGASAEDSALDSGDEPHRAHDEECHQKARPIGELFTPLIRYALGADEQDVEQYCAHAHNYAQDEQHPIYVEVGVVERNAAQIEEHMVFPRAEDCHMQGAVHERCRHYRRRAGEEHGGGELALTFFQHEHKPRERRIEGDGESRSRTRGDEVSAPSKARF